MSEKPMTDAEIAEASARCEHFIANAGTYGFNLPFPVSPEHALRLCRDLQAVREVLQGIRDCPKISPDQFEIFARHVADSALGGSR